MSLICKPRSHGGALGVLPWLRFGALAAPERQELLLSCDQFEFLALRF